MQESEFEKRVQDELGQLRLRPSAEVWQNVENELRKKKKRRMVFFIFFLAGLALLGYPGYKFYSQYKNDHSQFNNSQEHNSNSGNINATTSNNSNAESDQSKVTTEITPSGDSQKSNSNNTLANTEVKSDQNNPISNNSVVKSNPGTATKNEQSIKTNQTDKSSYNNPDDRSLAGVTVAGQRKNNTKGESIKQDKQGTGRNNQQSVDQPLVFVQEPTPTPSATQTISEPKAQTTEPNIQTMASSNQDTLIKPDSSVVKQDLPEVPGPDTVPQAKSKQKLSKWNWAIDFSAGISGSRENAFVGGPKAMADMLYFSSPTISLGAGTFGIPSQPPSAIKPGFSFRAGLVGERNISKRSSIVTGLQYHYKSTSIHTGAYVDTSFSFSNFSSRRVQVDAAYRGSQNHSYTNHYHFIQIPIEYQWKVSKSEKLPLYWNIGTGVTYLIASKGLLYDNIQGGIYYQEKDAYNKFQVNLNTAFYFRFGNKQRMSWMVGPEFSMDMSRLVKEAYGNKQYLYYGGVSARYYLTPKK